MFQRMQLLQEPFLVVGAFFLLFVAVIIYVRLDFSITKVSFSCVKLLCVIMNLLALQFGRWGRIETVVFTRSVVA